MLVAGYKHLTTNYRPAQKILNNSWWHDNKKEVL
jgi:hypothetical protein